MGLMDRIKQWFKKVDNVNAAASIPQRDPDSGKIETVAEEEKPDQAVG
jgi:hypothetical protein